MNSTGVFTEDMKDFFGASDGAYTAFTSVEIKKGTFNVKSVIRGLLIDKLGRENIPVVNVSAKQTIEFQVCDKAKIYGKDKIDIPCKFSKRDSDEMTIYFNTAIIDIFNAEAGDYWYIYFKESNIPIVGIMSKDKWDDLFDLAEDAIVEPDEKEGKELIYTGEVSKMTLLEEEAPERSTVQLIMDKTKVRKSLSAENAALKEKNRKKKGDRGEEIAIEIEKRRLEKLGRSDLVSKITHVAKNKDGLGYDIISTDIDNGGNEVEIYIEVKATSGDKDMPFYVTARELEVSQKYQELYYIYRIYGLKEDADDAKYYRMAGAIDDNYELKPTEYRAKR